MPWLEVPWRRPLDYQKCAAQFDAICYVSAAFCFTCRWRSRWRGCRNQWVTWIPHFKAPPKAAKPLRWTKNVAYVQTSHDVTYVQTSQDSLAFECGCSESGGASSEEGQLKDQEDKVPGTLNFTAIHANTSNTMNCFIWQGCPRGGSSARTEKQSCRTSHRHENVSKLCFWSIHFTGENRKDVKFADRVNLVRCWVIVESEERKMERECEVWVQNADHSQSFEILRSRSKVKTFQARLSRNSLDVLVLLLVVFCLLLYFLCRGWRFHGGGHWIIRSVQHNLMQFVMFLLLSVSLAGDEAGEGAAGISEWLEYHTSKLLPRQPNYCTEPKTLLMSRLLTTLLMSRLLKTVLLSNVDVLKVEVQAAKKDS